MPSNKNAMTRYKILDELLSSRYHNYSIDDLTEEVNKRLADMYPNTNGVIRRTIEKDLNYLEYEGPFMVDIERYSIPSYDPIKQKTYSKRCLRYSKSSFSIFKKELSDNEKYLLKEIISILGQFDGFLDFDGIEDLSLKLGICQENNRTISFEKNYLEKSNLFKALFTAITQKQVIEIHYHTFKEPEKFRKINIYPYLLKEYNKRWYLFASSEEDGKFLNFCLDRIDNCIPLPSHKYMDYDGDINEVFEDVIGVTINEESPIYRILFWVSDDSMDFVTTKPIHESQRNVPKSEVKILRTKFPILNNGGFFRIDCKENYELIRDLTSFGQHLIVIEPEYIQNKIFDYVTCLQLTYLKLRR